MQLKKGNMVIIALSKLTCVDAVRIAYMNAGSLLKEKIKRLGQSNLSEAEKLNKTPTKAKPAAQISTDVTLLRVHAVYIMK